MPGRSLPEKMRAGRTRGEKGEGLFASTGRSLANYLRFRADYARMYQLPALRGRLQIAGMRIRRNFNRNLPTYHYYAEGGARKFGAGARYAGKGALHAGYAIGRPLVLAGRETAGWALAKMGERMRRHPLRNALLLWAFIGLHSMFTAGSAERYGNYIHKHPEYRRISAPPSFFDRRNFELAGAATFTGWAALAMMRRRLRKEGLIKK